MNAYWTSDWSSVIRSLSTYPWELYLRNLYCTYNQLMKMKKIRSEDGLRDDRAIVIWSSFRERWVQRAALRQVACHEIVFWPPFWLNWYTRGGPRWICGHCSSAGARGNISNNIDGCPTIGSGVRSLGQQLTAQNVDERRGPVLRTRRCLHLCRVLCRSPTRSFKVKTALADAIYM